MFVNWRVLEATENVCVRSGEKEKESPDPLWAKFSTGRPADGRKKKSRRLARKTFPDMGLGTIVESDTIMNY